MSNLLDGRMEMNDFCLNCGDTGLVVYRDKEGNPSTIIEHYCDCLWGKARMDLENTITREDGDED